MFILGNVIDAIAAILNWVINILWWLIIIRALLSWVNPDPFNPIVQFLYKVTDPVLEPFRKIFPFTYNVGIDLSPLIALLVLYFVKLAVVRSLIGIAMRLSAG